MHYKMKSSYNVRSFSTYTEILHADQVDNSKQINTELRLRVTEYLCSSSALSEPQSIYKEEENGVQCNEREKLSVMLETSVQERLVK